MVDYCFTAFKQVEIANRGSEKIFVVQNRLDKDEDQTSAK